MSSKKKKTTTIDIDFIKLPCYRTVHADGIFGALTPDGKLAFDFFHQKLNTPTSTQHEVTGNSVDLTKELGRKGKTSIIREIEVGIVMDIEVVKAVNGWLNTKIEEYNEKFGIEKKESTDE